MGDLKLFVNYFELIFFNIVSDKLRNMCLYTYFKTYYTISDPKK